MNKPVKAFYWDGTNSNELNSFKHVTEALLSCDHKIAKLYINDKEQGVKCELNVQVNSYVIQYENGGIIVYSGNDKEAKTIWEELNKVEGNLIEDDEEFDRFVGKCLRHADMDGLNLTYQQIEFMYAALNTVYQEKKK